MDSPVVQARLRAQFLRRLLSENDERMLEVQLGGLLPKRFNKYWPVDIIVAVWDTGRISRGREVAELLKADQAAGWWGGTRCSRTSGFASPTKG
jgi:hypothetical protein